MNRTIPVLLLVWTFGAVLPVLFTSFLPLLSTLPFPNGDLFARPDPPVFSSISYYICESASAGTFAVLLSPGLAMMWWLSREQAFLSAEMISLFVMDLAWLGMLAFPQSSLESVHTAFLALLISMVIIYTFLIRKRIGRRSEWQKRGTTAILWTQTGIALLLAITHIVILFGREVGYLFFVLEVMLIGVSGSIVPLHLTILSLEKGRETREGEDVEEATTATTTTASSEGQS